MNWFVKCLNQYADFSGRARRTEYWMFTLVNCVIALVLGFVVGGTGLDFISWIYSLAILIPSLAVCIRRLHDIGKSGWWYLICFIPLVGTIILLIWFCTDSQPGDNQWGPNPKGIQ